jgi:hypothetical protein
MNNTLKTMFSGPKGNSGVPDQNKTIHDLAIRNQKLVNEVNRLQGINSDLRRKVSNMNHTLLSIYVRNKTDCGTQTDDISIVDTLDSFPPAVYSYSPSPSYALNNVRKSHRRCSHIPIEPLSLLSPTVGSSVRSPCQQRVSAQLLENLGASPIPVLGYSTPTARSPLVEGSVGKENENESEGNLNMSIVGRTPRATKKPVSYQEPSLRVKVRKGFKFFTFS